jgi:hypothetical protein
MTEFWACVRKHFDFLIKDFRFAQTAAVDPVRYDAATLYVEVWRDKGQIDLIVGVKVDTEIIRPYVSHRFSIAEIVRYYKTGPFPTLASFRPCRKSPARNGVSSIWRRWQRSTARIFFEEISRHSRDFHEIEGQGMLPTRQAMKPMRDSAAMLSRVSPGIPIRRPACMDVATPRIDIETRRA